MVARFCFFLALLASPFKSTSRLEAENAAPTSADGAGAQVHVGQDFSGKKRGYDMENQSEKLDHQVAGLPSLCLASSRIQFSVHTAGWWTNFRRAGWAM